MLKAKEIRLAATGTGDKPKKTLTTAEAAVYLGVSQQTIYKLTMARKIPFYKPNGKNNYFDVDELDAWVKRRRIATAEEINDRAMAATARG